MTIEFSTSVIFVKDIQLSRRFYEELLEQKVSMDHGENVVFERGFAIWQVEHAFQIIFATPEIRASQTAGNHCELYFETDDLDTVLEKATNAGVRFIHTVQEQPWGQRVFRICDPDGYMVELGEPMTLVVKRLLAEGMTPGAITRRISMPLDFVQQVKDKFESKKESS